MIKTYFRLRPGEPRNLELTLGEYGSRSREKNFFLAVKWQDAELGRFADRNSVLQGRVFTLDDGGQLSVRLASAGWGMPYRILLNGVPIADKGVQDGFDAEASQLGSSGWYLILWGFVSTLFWGIMLSLGLVQSSTAEALGVQGGGGMPWTVFLPKLINYNFDIKPFGALPFGVLAAGLICLGALLLIMRKPVNERKQWALYPGLLIHWLVAICGWVIAFVTGSGTYWGTGLNAGMFTTLVLGGLLGFIYLVYALISLKNLNSIQRYKTGK